MSEQGRNVESREQQENRKKQITTCVKIWPVTPWCHHQSTLTSTILGFHLQYFNPYLPSAVAWRLSNLYMVERKKQPKQLISLNFPPSKNVKAKGMKFPI